MGQDITATPAPTKTVTAPTATPTQVAAEEPTDWTPRPLPRAYTQDDFQVLVGNVQRPNGMLWFEGNLYTACNGDFTLYEVHAITGQTRTLVYGIQNAHALWAEPNGASFDLWVPDFDTNRLMRISQGRQAPRPVASNLNGPWGITKLNATDFLVSNIRSNDVVRISQSGEISQFLDGFRAPAGITIHDGFLYVVNNGSARRAIERIALDGDGLPVGEPQPFVSGLQSASGIVVGADGYVYFSYSLGARGIVGRVAPSACKNGCSNDDVEIVVFTDLQAPLAGLTLSPDMRLFVHTIFRPEIYWLDIYPSD
ncbi:MAG: hypothetical protein SNJ54_06715 [Anaerolineae bacterium]